MRRALAGLLAVAALAGHARADDTVVLFGDLHVHSTHSSDALLFALPMFGGRGSHPIDDACDYARYCSGVDFWASTDHAESLGDARWRSIVDDVGRCDARTAPRTRAFIGFEWSQMAPDAADHYGHQNVIFPSLDPRQVARRPITATGLSSDVLRSGAMRLPLALVLLDALHARPYLEQRRMVAQIADLPACTDPAQAAACYAQAPTPFGLKAALDAQQLAYLMIPHGTTWGFYTPGGVTLDKLRGLAPPLVELVSGHGNGEEFRTFRELEGDTRAGSATCPEPTADYLPACWRAGEIIEGRCLAAGAAPAECAARAAATRAHFLTLSIAGHLAVPGAGIADWQDAGQCRDCFQPSFNYRPGGSVQYGLALGAVGGAPFEFGFVGGSDNHRSRPGTGYAEIDRRVTTESYGPRGPLWGRLLGGRKPDPAPFPNLTTQAELAAAAGINLTELERQNSYWYTGGLVAVHARDASRAAIWEALQARRVYATSGPRIELRFDLLPGRDGTGPPQPMGSTVATAAEPAFTVAAAGAWQNLGTCPGEAVAALGAARVRDLCGGNCWSPGDRRMPLDRIEVVRIRPRVDATEDIASRIDDPWRVHDCGGRGECAFAFRDPDYADGGRNALYYVRAIQQPTPAINAGNLNCRWEDGRCVAIEPCHGDWRTPADDNCTAPHAERAWSSPIFLHHPAAVGGTAAAVDGRMPGPPAAAPPDPAARAAVSASGRRA